MTRGAPNRDAAPDFEQLVRGKRVVVVGPATHTVGAALGREVDSYDLVVRLNEAIAHMPFDRATRDDIGGRADIVYGNQVVLRTLITGRTSDAARRSWIDAGLKYFVCTNNALDYANTGEPARVARHPDPRLVADCDDALRRLEGSIRLRIVHAASALLSKWMGGHFGRTGFIALYDLLSFDVRCLHVTGMTFYHGGGHRYPQGRDPLHPLKNRDGTWARDAGGRGHDSYLELEIMRVLARCFQGRLTVDAELNALLSL